MNYQYKIFYSWQSDNIVAKKTLRKALQTVVKQLKEENISIEIVEGGGGEGFISIEDAVRMKIQKCDIFVGDVTPVGNVAMKDKLLPNANVMYEMGIATESMTADRIIAVVMAGDWKIEHMPFDFNHYSMVYFKENKENHIKELTDKIKNRIKETDKITRRINNRFFSKHLLNRNIESGKYLPATFLENRNAKEKARIFSVPYKMYSYLFGELAKMSFAVYNRKRKRQGQGKDFVLDLTKWDIKGKTIDIDKLQDTTCNLLSFLKSNVNKLGQDNLGHLTSWKITRIIEKIELLNKKILIMISDAGQGKTNFVCDLVHNLFIPEEIPYVFVNAYELLAEQPSEGIAHEYNYIGDGSLESVILKAERLCQQKLQYFIVVIDGLNENIHQRLFRNNLNRVLGALVDYHHVKVILTCRKTFYEQNYESLRDTFIDNITEVSLETKHNDGKMEENEKDCIIERYSEYFKTKGDLKPSLREELLGNKLLMRIFFETNRDQNVSNQDFVDRLDLYEKYFHLLCDKIQKVIEQSSPVSNISSVAANTFENIIQWMINHNCFRNLPYEDVVKILPHNENQYFESFLNANLILSHDSIGTGRSDSDVINFTFEEIRDFLTIKYLFDKIYSTDKNKFWSLVDKFTESQNNQAEGIKRYLFLYAKNNARNDILIVLKTKEWYKDTFNDYIWEVKDEQQTNDDVDLVKELILSNNRDTIRYLSLYHWSPVIHPKINLYTLFDVLDNIKPAERKEILAMAWDYKKRLNIWGVHDITERSYFLRELARGIKKRNKTEYSEERTVLEKYYRYLKDTSDKFVFDPSIDDDSNNDSFNVIGYDYCHYLMTVHKGTKKDFLKRAGVRKGFAKKMFEEIYDTIFEESKDVEEIYNTYYKKEYPNITQFISMYYSIPKKKVKQYTDAIETGNYRIIDFSSLDYGNSSIEELFSSDEMFIKLYNWLNWKDDENKN